MHCCGKAVQAWFAEEQLLVRLTAQTKRVQLAFAGRGLLGAHGCSDLDYEWMGM
jgi:hypothetical protein